MFEFIIQSMQTFIISPCYFARYFYPVQCSLYPRCHYNVILVTKYSSDIAVHSWICELKLPGLLILRFLSLLVVHDPDIFDDTWGIYYRNRKIKCVVEFRMSKLAIMQIFKVLTLSVSEFFNWGSCQHDVILGSKY